MQRSNSASFMYNGRQRSMTPSLIAAMTPSTPSTPTSVISINNALKVGLQKPPTKKAADLATLDAPELYVYYYSKFSI